MQVDSLALHLRPRPMYEAADLGVRLAQQSLRTLWRCYAPVALAVFVIAMALSEISDWLPFVFIFIAKPWLDRTLLFVFSRAAFAVPTSWSDLWCARKEVCFGQLLRTFTLRRLSPRRSFTQAVYQLEGLRGAELGRRLGILRKGKRGVSAMVTGGFSMVETGFTIAVVSLLLWFAPPEHRQSVWNILVSDEPTLWSILSLSIYPLIALTVEPFYVAAGFVMYLNRRVELEAWDIEQELRRVFR